MRAERTQMGAHDRLLLGLGALALLLATGLIAAIIYLAHQASIATLRWWTVAATLALPATAAIAYTLGRTEARGHIAGLTQGVEAVSGAAQRVVEAAGHVADVRVVAAQRMRQQRPAAAPFQQFILPGLPGLTTGPAGLIMPPQQVEEDVEL
jgi:hypothetical protein